MKTLPSPARKSSRSAAARTKREAEPLPGGKPLQIQRILVPVDFSKAGEAAIDYAAAMARFSGAEVHLLHVLEPIHPVGQVYPGGEGFYFPLEEGRRREHATREIGILQARHFPDIRTDFEIRSGSCFEAIVDVAKASRSDLIVIATHGYTGMRHLLLGSTAERVVRYATCPVLVVRSAPVRKPRSHRRHHALGGR